MKQFAFFAVPTAFLLLTSCGSDEPKGKFTDKEKSESANVNPDAIYIKNEQATAWIPGWPENNTLVYHWRGEPDNMHPTNGKSNPRRMVMEYTQRFLVNTDIQNLVLRPDLVKALPTVSENGLEFTYELRDDVTWDNGAKLSMEDVIFSIMANKCPNTANPHAKPYLESIADIRLDKENALKFTIVMSRKYIQNVALFGDLPIMQRTFHDKDNVLKKYTCANFNDANFNNSKHPDLEKWAEEFNRIETFGRDIKYLNGLGAYALTAWEEGQRLELTKKSNHWTSKIANRSMYEQAYPEKIIFKRIVDDNAINLELKKQQLDVSTWVGTLGLIDLQKDPEFNKNYHSSFILNYDYQYIGMNLKPQSVNRKPFFIDKKVRRAMALLSPLDEINSTFIADKCIRMTSLVSPIKKSIYNDELKPIPFDIAQAKQLLDEAGWKDTDGDNIRDKMIDGKKVKFEFEFSIIGGSLIIENIAKRISESMRQAGVIASIHPYDLGKFYENCANHDFDMYMGAWSSSFVPEDYKQIWHSGSWQNGGSNYVGFGTPATDQLIEAIRAEINDSARIVMEKKLQAIVYDEQPYIFMFVSPRKVAIHRRFANPDMYLEKPGVCLSNLRAMTASTIMQPAETH